MANCTCTIMEYLSPFDGIFMAFLRSESGAAGKQISMQVIIVLVLFGYIQD